MYLGIIKWFNAEKGYGVIQTTDTSFAFNHKDKESVKDTGTEKPYNEIFLHIKNWIDAQQLSESSEVPLIFEIAEERNKIAAKKCRYFDASDDALKLLVDHLGLEEEIEVKTGRYSIHIINIISSGLQSIKGDIEKSLFSGLIINKIDSLNEEQKERGLKTLLGVIQKVDNESLKDALKTSLVSVLVSYAPNKRFDLWRDDLIDFDQMFKEDFFLNIDRISIKDLEEISSIDIGGEIISSLLLQKISLMTNPKKRDFKALSETIQSCANKCDQELITKVADEMFDREVLVKLKTHKKTDGYRILGTIEEAAGLIDAAKPLLSEKCIDTAFSILNYFSKEYGSINDQIEVCLKGYLTSSAVETTLLNNVTEISGYQLERLFKQQENLPNDLLDKIIAKITTPPNIRAQQLEVLERILDDQDWRDIDTNLKGLLSEEEYFALWRSGVCGINSIESIAKYLDDNSQKYLELEQWINSRITKEEAMSILGRKIDTLNHASTRVEFQTAINILSFIQKHIPENLDKYKSSNDQLYSLILWYLSETERLDFPFLKGKFIYFSPEQQVAILKRLFMLKKTGVLDFTIDTFDHFTRADIDLYYTNLRFTNDFILDPSTDLIIESLKSFAHNNKFITNSDIFKIIYRNIGSNKKRKFMIGCYFDKCPGRTSAKYNWGIQRGKIILTPFGDKQYFFKIELKEYDERLVSLIKRLPGRKYNADEKYWGVPSKYQDQVVVFAHENNFFLDLKSNHYKNNEHLIEYYKEDEKPNGIIFCEGMNAQKQMYNKDFWWCANQPCFQNNENLHDPEDWKNYTLLDFLHILGYGCKEKSGYGYFEIGLYNQLVSQVNRFNQLLERLYCRECGDILYPIESSNYAAYNVTRFHCINKKCNDHQKPVYLNHCLNGQCNSIIDSRDSKQCPNGLYVCPNCGSCCSHDMFTRRLDNLSKNGGFMPNQLLELIRSKAGHLEKAEYYCYSCGGMMTPNSDNTLYLCDRCGTTYDLDKYRIKYPHLSLRRPDYPKSEF